MNIWDAMLEEAHELRRLSDVGHPATIEQADAAYVRAMALENDAALLMRREAERLLAVAMDLLRTESVVTNDEQSPAWLARDDREYALRTGAQRLVAVADSWGRKPKRQAVPLDVRVVVYRRDGYVCVECGEANPALLTVDHRIPVVMGGENLPDNLRTLCRRCNSSKGGRL